VILHMLEIGAVQVFHDPLITGIADIQKLSETHEIVSRSKSELWHRILTHYLPLYFPEAERFYRSSRTDWFLALLEKYPTPHMITTMSREGFITDAWAGSSVARCPKSARSQVFAPRRPALWGCRSTRAPTPFECSASCWPKGAVWFDSATRSRRGPSSFCPIIPTASF